MTFEKWWNKRFVNGWTQQGVEPVEIPAEESEMERLCKEAFQAGCLAEANTNESTLKELIEWVQRQRTFAEEHRRRNLNHTGQDAHDLCMYWTGQLDALEALLHSDVLNKDATDQPSQR